MACGIGLCGTRVEDAHWPDCSIFITETGDEFVPKHMGLVIFSFFFPGCSHFPPVCLKHGLLI